MIIGLIVIIIIKIIVILKNGSNNNKAQRTFYKSLISPTTSIDTPSNLTSL